MEDPMGRVKESDRRAVIRTIEDAFRDGSIVEADRDFRIEQVRAATTRTDLDLVTRDLAQRSADWRGSAETPTEPPAAPEYQHYQQPTGRPAEQPPEEAAGQPADPSYPPYQPHAGTRAAQVSRAGGAGRGIVLAMALVVVLLVAGGMVSGLLVSIQEGGDELTDLGVDAVEEGERGGLPAPAPPEFADPLTPRGFKDLRDVVEAETGSTVVREAALYPEYAVFTAGSKRQSHRYYYDQRGLREMGDDSRDMRPVDLARIDPKDVRRLIRRANTLVKNPTSRYLLIRRQGGNDSAVLAGYAINDARKAGYVLATLDGRVVRTYP